MAAPVRSKRLALTEDHLPQRPNKRERKAEQGPILNARIVIVAEEAKQLLNSVWMHPEDISPLFPSHQDQDLVRLAGRVFNLRAMPSLPRGTILLNRLQSTDVVSGKFNDRGSEEIVVSPGESLEDYPSIARVEIQFTNLTSKEILAVSVNDLRKMILTALHDKVVTDRQNFYIEISGHQFKFTTTLESPKAHRITGTTQIDFFECPNLQIYKKKVILTSENQQKVKLELTDYETLNGSDKPCDKFVKVKDLKARIIQYISNDIHFNDQEKTFKGRDGVNITITMIFPQEEEDLKPSKYGYQTGYAFDASFNDFKLKIATELNQAFTFYADEEEARLIEFEVTSRNSQKKYVPLQTLTKFIRSFPGLLEDQTLNKVGETSLDLKIRDIQPTLREKDTAFRTLRKLTDATEFKFVLKNKHPVIVDNKKPIEVSEITLKVKQLPQSPLSFFFGGGSTSAASLVEKQLETACRLAFKKFVFANLSLTVDCEDTKKKWTPLNVKVKELKFTDAPSLPQYCYLGEITDATKFKFEAEQDSKVYLAKEKSEQTELELVKSEWNNVVGGISEHFETIYRKVMLPRGHLKEDYKARGLKPIKGMLLYGPPGTGKTTLARSIGKMLGCTTQERFQLLNGPELTNKYVGNTEEKIRELFKFAEEAQKKDGDKSELHIIVIDECESILPTRRAGSDQPWMNSWVNQFLGKIDGLNALNNLFIVLMSNRKEIIDPAILRPGRIELHLELKLPDEQGRKEIFEIHTKKLRELNLLNQVDFQVLVEKTKGFSGADIEGIVKDASTYPLERAAKENIPGVDIRVTMDDFLKAIAFMKNSIKTDEPPPGMYT